MEFSSANVPISRETWAPKSPVRAAQPPSREYAQPPNREPYAEPPTGPRDEAYMRDAGRENGARNGNGHAPYERDERDRTSSSRDYRAPDRPREAHGYSAPRSSAPPARVSEPNPVLGVFGLSIRTRERDLEDEFGRFGDVEKVVIVYDQRSDRSRGFGFITMRTTDDAQRCVDKLNGFMLHGRAIRVDFSATQRPHQPTPGEYMGIKRPLPEDTRGDRYRSDDRYDDRRERDRPRYDDRDRRGQYDRDRYDDRYRDRTYPRRDEDPYSSRSRRDDAPRRSPPPRRRDPSPDANVPRRSRYSASPDRRPPPREYEAPNPPTGDANPRY